MPQMAPISWLILFFVFTIAFLLFNIMNYYCFYYNSNNNNNNNNNVNNNETINENNNNNKMNWKW